MSHSWCKCFVGHVYGGLGAGMEVVDGEHAGTCQGTSRVQGDALMIPDHTAFKVHRSLLCRVGIGRSSGKALARTKTRRLRFVFHAAGWLHSMVLHGRCN